jgi:hypothetical protein
VTEQAKRQLSKLASEIIQEKRASKEPETHNEVVDIQISQKQ